MSNLRMDDLKEPIMATRSWRDESLAPEVDLDLLRALVRKELPEDKARTVYRLIHSFASWDAAHSKMLVEEHRRQQNQKPG